MAEADLHGAGGGGRGFWVFFKWLISQKPTLAALRVLHAAEVSHTVVDFRRNLSETWSPMAMRTEQQSSIL